MLKSSSSKATADGSTGGVASRLRWGCFRGENAAGGLFQQHARAGSPLWQPNRPYDTCI